MQISVVHAVVTAIAGASIGIMAVCLVAVDMPRDSRHSPYHISRYILAAGYTLLSVACILAVAAGVRYSHEVNPTVRVITLATAALQGVLFQYTILSLINPMSLSLRRIMASLVPILAVDLVLVCTYLWGGERLSGIVFHVVCGLYFLLLAIYERIFRREYDDYMVAMNNYFAGDESFRLRWIRRAYYLAVSLGILAGVSLFLPSVPFVAFIGLVAVFYVYYAVRYIGYGRVFPRMAPALEPVFDEVGEPQTGRDEVAAKVGEWIAEKGFSQPGITLASMSGELGLPHSAVAMYIRSQGGRSFRRWINELRVDEARQVMTTCPGMSMQEVAEMAGFRSLRLFVRSFEAVEGEEPRYFRERVGGHAPEK